MKNEPRTMNILLHICCGPCAIYCVSALREKGHSVKGFFYNPNIHPVAEYDKRREAVITACKKINLKLKFHREYLFEDFFRGISGDEYDKRCQFCWRLRLDATARAAKEASFTLFTTTLLISPYQDQKMIKVIGDAVAKEHGVGFYFQDFSTGFRQSQKASREMGIYHQKYCGCIYSERERYKKI